MIPVGMAWLQRNACIAMAVVGFAGLCGTAQAAPQVTLEWFAGNDNLPPIVYDLPASGGSPMGSGGFQFTGADSMPGMWAMEWSISAMGSASSQTGAASGGPAFVTADLAVTNTTNQFQTFFALVTVALDEPIMGPTLTNGAVSASVTNAALFGSATLQTITSGDFAGDPIYTSLIDGADHEALWPAPFSLVADGPLATNSAATDFGTPMPIVGPEALETISVWLKIELSPGDTANVIGTFEVAAMIPSPAGLPILAAAALFGVRRRRRG